MPSIPERSNVIFTGLCVEVGTDVWETLHERIGMLPGRGQLWRTDRNQYVVSHLDVRGQLCWSYLSLDTAVSISNMYGRVPLFRNVLCST